MKTENKEIIEFLDKKIQACIDQAEVFKIAEMYSSESCSNAMAFAYINVRDFIEAMNKADDLAKNGIKCNVFDLGDETNEPMPVECDLFEEPSNNIF